MSDKQKGYIKSIIVFAVIVFSLCCYIKEPIVFGNYTSYAGYAITSTTVMSIIYVNWGWHWNPLEKIPRLNQNYIGKIEYRYNGVDGEKATNIVVKQSLFSTRIKIITDEITSASISSEIIEENGAYVMYYTYILHSRKIIPRIAKSRMYTVIP